MSQIQVIVPTGSYKKICSIHRGQPFLVLGPSKTTCILLLLTVNAISIFMLIFLSMFQQAYLFFMVHLVIVIYIDITWVAAGIINPGIIPQAKFQQYNCTHCKERTLADDWQMTIREHCTKCGVCIEERNHHCSIIGGCVGRGNKLCFYFYILALVLWCVDVISTAPYIYYLK